MYDVIVISAFGGNALTTNVGTFENNLNWKKKQ